MLSGPIKLNRAFYNVSFQYDDNHRDLRTLLDIDAVGLQAVGISQDSVAPAARSAARDRTAVLREWFPECQQDVSAARSSAPSTSRRTRRRDTR